jgi:outer membrane biosynthesis protein TonB
MTVSEADRDGQEGPAMEPERGGLWRLVTPMSRKRPKPSRPAIVGAVALHVLLLTGLWHAHRQLVVQPADFRTYRVNLVSPPPAEAGEPEAPAATPQIVQQLSTQQTVQPPRPVEQPRPQPIQPQRQPPPTPRPTPPVATPPPTPPARTPPADPTPPAATARGNNPRPVEVAGDGVNVQQDGLDFPFPEYLQNIILQVNRHFRWTGSPNLESRVHFFIRRDGSVGSINVMTRSGNFQFDVEAMRAVEQAGGRGAFGPLPAGWQQDVLWISFKFLPPG